MILIHVGLKNRWFIVRGPSLRAFHVSRS